MQHDLHLISEKLRGYWRVIVIVCAIAMQACDSEHARFTSKQVAPGMLVGTWQLHQNSSSEMARAIDELESSFFFPWQTLQLNPDGTFTVSGHIVRQDEKLITHHQTVSGSWKIDLRTPMHYPPSATVVLEIETRSDDGLLRIAVFKLFVMKYETDYLLWNWFGDLDMRRYQEYYR